MSEHITDSNILQSRKTYGRKKDDKNSSFSSEKSGSFPGTASEDLINNGMLSFIDYDEDLHSEEDFDFIASITGSFENNTIQNDTVVDSQFSLFTEIDMEYHYSEKSDQNDSSIIEISNSGSNYQRTRKNQKNRLSNLQYSSEEISESTLHSHSLTSYSNKDASKSTSDISNLNPTPAKQPLLITRDKQMKHTKINGIKTTDACVNKSPQRPNLFQAGKIFGEGTNSHTPLSNTKLLPILDLVNRFTASRSQDNSKSNKNNKRKKVKEEYVSIPSKKIATVVKNHASSVIKSVENKILNSTVSVKRYSKSTVLKTDTVSYVDTFNESGFQSPPKSDQRKKRVSINSAEKSVNILGNIINSSPLKRDDVKTPVKAVKKRKGKFVDEASKQADMRQNVNGVVKTLSKVVQRKNSRSGSNTRKNLKKDVSKNSSTKNTTTAKVKSSFVDLHLVRKYNKEIHYGDQQLLTSNNDNIRMEKFNDQTLNTPDVHASVNCSINMPLIIAPMPPSYEYGTAEVIPLGIWKTSTADDHTFRIDDNMVSYENFGDLSVPGPSTLTNNSSSNVEASENIYFITKDTTTTTVKKESHENDKQKSVFRPRTHLCDGFDFFGFLSQNLKRMEENCILHCKEKSSETFLMNPALLHITVKDFCNNLAVTDVLLDFLTRFDVNKSLAVHNANKGYDFPENFESESLLRVVKDFVHTMISYIITPNAVNSLNISGSHIIKHSVLNMSSREIIIMVRLFRKPDQLYRLKDVLANLSLVALFVIFDEYRNKKYRYVS